MIKIPGYLHVVVHLSLWLFGSGSLDHATGELLLLGISSHWILADAIVSSGSLSWLMNQLQLQP